MIPQTLLMLGLVAGAARAPVQGQGAVGSERGSLHAPFTELLQKHVRGDRVDYDGFAREPRFQAYLRSLENAHLDTMSKDELLAFWINTYNAYVIQLINRHQERESIRNINKFLGVLRGEGPWKEEIVRAGGYTISLDDVQRRILREQFKEPRIHMALVGAALSSPPLRTEAYEAGKLETQLQDQTRTFLRERQVSNRLDLGSQILYLSPIFDWNREDFGDSDAALIRFVAPFFEGVSEREAFAKGKLQIEFTEYDWSLNIQQGLEAR